MISPSYDKDGTILPQIRQEYLEAKSPLQIKGLQELLQLQGEGDCDSDMRNRITAQPPRSMLPNVFQITVGQAQHQPPIQYRLSFVKHIIKQLESAATDKPRNDDGEEDEDFSMWYDALESLSNLENHSEPFYRLYDIDGDGRNVIKIFENEAAFVAEGTTGLITWEASKEMAKWFNLPNHKILNHGWILELGCGCGFLSIAALRIFPHLSKYVATDGHPSAIEKAASNLEANFGSFKLDVIQTQLIDWLEDENKFQTIVKDLTQTLGPGILLGADIVFDPTLIPPLVKLIDIFLDASEMSTTFLSCTIRNKSTIEVLETYLGAEPNRRVKPSYKWENGVILEITRVYSDPHCGLK